MVPMWGWRNFISLRGLRGLWALQNIANMSSASMASAAGADDDTGGVPGPGGAVAGQAAGRQLRHRHGVRAAGQVCAGH